MPFVCCVSLNLTFSFTKSSATYLRKLYYVQCFLKTLASLTDCFLGLSSLIVRWRYVFSQSVPSACRLLVVIVEKIFVMNSDFVSRACEIAYSKSLRDELQAPAKVASYFRASFEILALTSSILGPPMYDDEVVIEVYTSKLFREPSELSALLPSAVALEDSEQSSC